MQRNIFCLTGICNKKLYRPVQNKKAEEKVHTKDVPQEKPSEQKTDIEQPAQKLKTASPQEQSQSAAANTITLNANNLAFAVNTNPLNETARKQGAQQGLTLLQPEKYPVLQCKITAARQWKTRQ